MYEQFFGLCERPFDLTPNPRYLLLTPRHREALSNLEYAIAARKGVALLIGDAGTGKTTLIRKAIETQPNTVKCVYVNNPSLTRMEFLEFLSRAFELGEAAEKSKTTLLGDLERRLMDYRREGTTVALIIDEAQSLPHELLEEIRLLTNIETTSEKLLTVILAGQPELADRINNRALRQLKQRVELRCNLAPLDLMETAAYMAGRIRTAGGDSAMVFTRDAVLLIYERSGGIPRTISVICDNALISAFAANQRPVRRDIVLEVCRDFDHSGETAPERAVERAAAPASRNLGTLFRMFDGTPGTPARETGMASTKSTETQIREDVPAEAASGRRRRFFF